MDTVRVKYIGKRKFHTDRMYGTGLTWERDQILDVPADKASIMLRKHPDVYKKARARNGGAVDEDPEVTTKTNAVDPEPDKDEFDEETEIAKQSIRDMTKSQIIEFVKVNFQVELSERDHKQDLVDSAIRLIDQFGLPESGV